MALNWAYIANKIIDVVVRSGNNTLAINPDGSILTRSIGSDPKGKEVLTVTTASAVGFATVPVGATRAIVTIESADIRYWIDGSTPTATQGHQGYSRSGFELTSAAEITNFKAIGVSASATLQISYY